MFSFFVQIDSSNVSGKGGRGKYCTQLKGGGAKIDGNKYRIKQKMALVEIFQSRTEQ